MEQGWDPEVKKYFKKVLFSVCYGLIWLMTMVALGLYQGWAYRSSGGPGVVIFFYIFMAVTFFFLFRFYYRTWKK